MALAVDTPGEFRAGIRAIYAGSTQETCNLPLYDFFVQRCIYRFPNIRHVHFLNIAGLSTKALWPILDLCPKIKSIVIITKPGAERDFTALDLYHTMRNLPKSLRYLELDGFEADEMSKGSGVTSMLTYPGRDLEVV
jgi:hypothetical protein